MRSSDGGWLQTKVGMVYIGCSGYVYSHWRQGVFYPKKLPQKEEFSYYANKFATVEINNTFYQLPKANVWKNWKERAPSEFIYALKMSRYLTHLKKLKEPQEAWHRFWSGAKKLKNHLGPILFQLPPYWQRDVERLKNLANVLPKNLRFAFEFRGRSWLEKSVYKVLKQNNWALVLISHPDLPFLDEVTADFVYLRFHGGGALYQSSYSKGELKKIARKIKKWLEKDLDVYAYFNNDAEGNAPRNALILKELVDQ